MHEIHQYRLPFLLSSRQHLLQIDKVHKFLSEESYWAKGITQATVLQSLQHSLCLGIYHEEKQVAFGRMVTDRATFAYLCDIFVLADYRGKELGKWLMEGFNNWADMWGLRRVLLTTQDAHTFYEQCGYGRVPWPERLMYKLPPSP